MFKAKLIEDPSFYSKRRLNVFFYFLPAIPCAFIINYAGFPLWVTILAVLAYVGILFIAIKNQKKLTTLSQERMIELDESMLRINNKAKNSTIEIDLANIHKIGISRDYGIPEESMKDIANELSGEPKQNFIILSNNHQEQRFDFIIESYYMLKQFENIIESWIKKGYTIERI